MTIPLNNQTKKGLNELIDEFYKIDFNEGTLVEYQHGCGFDFERNRGLIRRCRIDENILSIFARDGELDPRYPFRGVYFSMHKSDSDGLVCAIVKLENVFYLFMPQIHNYAVSQKGIIIPKMSSHELFGGDYDGK